MDNVNIGAQPQGLPVPQGPNPIASALVTTALGAGIQVGADYFLQKHRIKHTDKLDEFISRAKEIELNKPKTGARLLKTAEMNKLGKVNWKSIGRSAGLVAGITFIGSLAMELVFAFSRAKKMSKMIAEAQAQQAQAAGAPTQSQGTPQAVPTPQAAPAA